MQISFSFDDAADNDYVFIAAGETKTVEHDRESYCHYFNDVDHSLTFNVVAALYDFESAGAGAFSFAPVTTFQVAPVSALVKSQADLISIEVISNTVDVFISSDVARLDPESKSKRGIITCSNSFQASTISASYTEAKELARLASSYITSNGASSLYTAYYSSNSPSTVASCFNAVANESGPRTFSCTDTYGVCGGGVIAYTVIATTNVCSILVFLFQ